MEKPQIYDADYSIIKNTKAYARVPQWQIITARMVCATLSLAPIIVSMLGGLCGWWSVKAGVVGAIVSTLALAGVHAMFDHSSVLHTQRGTLMMLVVLVVIIATTGCSKQPDHNQAAAEKRATLEQYAPEVEKLKGNPGAFKQAVEQCGRANDARVKAGQLGSSKDYRCAAIAQAYYSQHTQGAVFQGGSLDDNRN